MCATGAFSTTFAIHVEGLCLSGGSVAKHWQLQPGLFASNCSSLSSVLSHNRKIYSQMSGDDIVCSN